MFDPLFNDDERDAFGEIVNVAMGRAAASLAEAFSGFVNMRVPEIRTVGVSDIVQTRKRLASTYERISVLDQEYFGEFAGNIAVVYGPASYAALRDVLGFDERDGDGRRQREELLLELGNALSNTCVSSMGELLELRTALRPPRMAAFDMPSSEIGLRLLGESQAWTGQTVMIDIVFHLEGHEIPFELLITVLPDCLPAVKLALSKHI